MNSPHDPGDGSEQVPSAGIAFLLAQLGAHAAARFAERAGELDLTPALTGVLRLIALAPGRSQQSLAIELGMLPSKVVTVIDDLQHRGLVERQRNPDDRRNHALHLTPEGRHVLGRVRDAAEAHEAELVTALEDTERAQLVEMLSRIATQQGLRPGVHPGYRQMAAERRPHHSQLCNPGPPSADVSHLQR